MVNTHFTDLLFYLPGIHAALPADIRAFDCAYVWLSHKSSTCHCHVCAYARYHTNPFFARYLFSHLGSRAKKAPLQVKTGRMRGCKTSAITDTTRVPLKLSYTGIQLTFILPPLSLSPSLPPPFPSKVHAGALQLMFLL